MGIKENIVQVTIVLRFIYSFKGAETRNWVH